MTFATSIQSLAGAHILQSTSFTQCAVDWPRERVFISNNNHIARCGLITGLEEAYATLASIGNVETPPVGIDIGGSIYMSGADSLYSGRIWKIDGGALTSEASGAYPEIFGTGGFACVSAGTGQFIIDVGPGGGIFGALSRTIISRGASYLSDVQWSSGGRCFPCAGQSGSNKGYFIETPTSSLMTQSLVLRSVTCATIISYATIGTIIPTDVDAAWTQIYCNGVCLDQTDGHLIVCVNGQSGATQRNYLIKVDVSDASIIWTCPVPANGSAVAGGAAQMSMSRIRNQKIALISRLPNTITIIDTSDGTSTNYTSGLADLVISSSAQCYDDTLGAIVGLFGYTAGAGAPTALNSTPSSYTGWMVLYVDDAIEPAEPTPIPGADTVTPYEPPIIVPPVRQLRLFPRPPFKEYRCGADGVSVFPVPFRVIEQGDLRVKVNGTELTQSDFTYTGRDSVMPGHETGYVTLDDPASDCIVRIWGDRASERTTDLDDGELDKTTANTEFETLWVADRCQALKLGRATDDPLTGSQNLPAAVAGLRYWFQGDCTATRAGSDTIYDGHSSGTVLTGTGDDSLAELVCVKKGLWFVRTKTGSWSVA